MREKEGRYKERAMVVTIRGNDVVTRVRRKCLRSVKIDFRMRRIRVRRTYALVCFQFVREDWYLVVRHERRQL